MEFDSVEAAKEKLLSEDGRRGRPPKVVLNATALLDRACRNFLKVSKLI